MNATTLKWIALVTMTIDHIGFFLISSDAPLYLTTRVIGRVAFPIFAFMIAQGFIHTKNRMNYAIRLLVFGIVVEAIFIGIYLLTSINYSIVPFPGGYPLSIAWSLIAGLLGLMFIHSKNRFFYFLLLPLLIASYFLQYSFYGFIMIIIFGLSIPMDKKINYVGLLTLFYVFYPLAFNARYEEINTIQLFAIFALGLIYLYNGQKGKGYKYLFYIYYPLHIVILFLIGYLF
ncbi:MAG: TraX family protein [Acholeplasmataceae bacterium]